MRVLLSVFLLCLLNLGPAEAKPRSIPPSASIWGGKHIQLSVLNRSASFQFDCAIGSIQNNWAPNRSGNLNVLGTLTRQSGVELPPDFPRPKPVVVRYKIKINGNQMSLDILTTESPAQHFDLIKGVNGELFRCM